MITKFKKPKHHQFYEGMVRMTHSHTDPYRQALFYLLGLTEQTVPLFAICTIDNGYSGDEDRDASRNYSPYFLFDTHLLPHFFRATKLRYPEYAKIYAHNFMQFPYSAAEKHEEFDYGH